MIVWNRFFRGGACLALALGAALAQSTTQTYRQTGNLLGANASVSGASYQANINITPVILQGTTEEQYTVYWSTTIYGNGAPPPVCLLPTDPPPPLPNMISTSAIGFVSAKAIQTLASGALVVDLTPAQLQNGFFGSQQCLNGTCMAVPPPPTFPLKGTFLPLTTGPGAFASSSSGTRFTLNIDPICKFATTWSGNTSDTASRFAGQIGNIPVPDTGVGSNGQVHVQKGQMTQTSTCTPPPPPPPPPM